MKKILTTSQRFQQKTSEKPESMVGAYRAESTHHWTAASGKTAKIPPLFNRATSWFNS